MKKLHWPSIRFSWDWSYWTTMGFGILLAIDDGWVSEEVESPKGQIWHMGARLVIRFFWLTCVLSVYSPFGRFVPYSDYCDPSEICGPSENLES